ncbi:hypothetical protein [Bradyrhizobium sp. I71]|uniref:hypothetical protein n=1 Tax=Bradyrhizobium sp. I71 TaxID=2590772 RepID=UPI001EF8E563|nr:hypothetical protein [Bradyrhizobium sp. I71]ULK95980.1 hypothetical protein FJV43_24940 [Bradyrhizobium sp. I71]
MTILDTGLSFVRSCSDKALPHTESQCGCRSESEQTILIQQDDDCALCNVTGWLKMLCFILFFILADRLSGRSTTDE